MMKTFSRFALAVAVLAAPATARPAAAENTAFVDALQLMMSQLRTESRAGGQRMREAYAPLVDRQSFGNLFDLQAALELDELALLAPDPLHFNIELRLHGASPIAEKDLANQATYLGARPAALGLLYEIASRVESSPVEVTSLVRHLQYQRALGATNGNARTEVPTHAMGLAFDIALVNTPLRTAYEIRDVLRQMRDAGSLIFIGESQQLVFHVVPTRAWLAYYEALHWAMRYAPAPRLPAPTLDDLMPRPVPPPVNL
ncbi:MAG: DUF5715 family protein [Acidobacteriota bacterium]|nr:DUF5715 family protein [Acidobacteriota bacterium]